MEENGGLISMDDLSSPWRPGRGNETCPRNIQGYRIVSMPPPSSGGTHMIQMLNMLEHFDVKGLGFGTAKGIHLLSEVMRRALRTARSTWVTLTT